MLRVILKREILHNLYSLRFLISLILVIAVFSAGALAFLPSHAAEVRNFEEVRRQALDGQDAPPRRIVQVELAAPPGRMYRMSRLMGVGTCRI